MPDVRQLLPGPLRRVRADRQTRARSYRWPGVLEAQGKQERGDEMSETPRTDAILTEWMPKITAADGDAECKAVILGFVRVLGYHARDLELELAATAAKRDEARRQVEALCGQLHNLRGPRTNWWEKKHWREWSLSESRKDHHE